MSWVEIWRGCLFVWALIFSPNNYLCFVQMFVEFGIEECMPESRLGRSICLRTQIDVDLFQDWVFNSQRVRKQSSGVFNCIRVLISFYLNSKSNMVQLDFIFSSIWMYLQILMTIIFLFIIQQSCFSLVGERLEKVKNSHLLI